MSIRSTIWLREETPELCGLHVYIDMIDGVTCLEVTCGPVQAAFILPEELLDKLRIQKVKSDV